MIGLCWLGRSILALPVIRRVAPALILPAKTYSGMSPHRPHPRLLSLPLDTDLGHIVARSVRWLNEPCRRRHSLGTHLIPRTLETASCTCRAQSQSRVSTRGYHLARALILTPSHRPATPPRGTCPAYRQASRTTRRVPDHPLPNSFCRTTHRPLPVAQSVRLRVLNHFMTCLRPPWTSRHKELRCYPRSL